MANRKRRPQGVTHDPEPPETAAPPTPGRVVVKPTMVELKLPMLRLTGPDGGARLPTRRLNTMLRTSEVQVLCDLCDGMRAAGEGKPRGTHKDALVWLLDRLGQAFTEIPKG